MSGQNVKIIMGKVSPSVRVAAGTTGSNTSEQVVSGRVELVGLTLSCKAGEGVSFIKLFDGTTEKLHFGTITIAERAARVAFSPGRILFTSGIAIAHALESRQLDYSIFYLDA